MEHKPTQIKDYIEKNINADTLALSRGMCYGGAATSLVFLLGVAQIAVKPISIYIAIFTAATALPAWLTLGFVYEYYFCLGSVSYPHLKTAKMKKSLMTYMGTAGCLIMISVGCLIYYLSPIALCGFTACALFGFLVIGSFNADLEFWWRNK